MRLLLLSAVLFFLACAEQQQSATAPPEVLSTANNEVQTAAPWQPILQLDSAMLTKAYLMGQFDPSQHPDFVEVEAEYADRSGLLLHKETYAAFLKMQAAAKADGVILKIRSATRPFEYQKGIWERKWTGERQVDGKDLSKSLPDAKARALKILEFSSMPGTSRHHWGTDIDLNSFENSYFEKGQGLKEYQWLAQNADKYGFCQVYSEKGDDRPHGYNLEKWHWSYLPLAQPLTEFAREQLKDTDIQGFMGAEVATRIGVVGKYVLGINPACR